VVIMVSSLKSVSEDCRIYFENLKSTMEEKAEQAQQDLNEATEILKITPSGDASENSTLDAARDACRKANIRVLNLQRQLYDIQRVPDLKNYNTCGVVVLYSTVAIRDNERGDEYAYRIFPGNIPDLDHHILSSDSMLGSALLGHRKGDQIEIRRRSGHIDHYTIQELY